MKIPGSTTPPTVDRALNTPQLAEAGAPSATPAASPKINVDDVTTVLRGLGDSADAAFGHLLSIGDVMLSSAPASTSGGPPILGKYQEARADQKYEALNGGDKETFGWLLGKAKSPDEQAYIRKALAAGYSMDDIEKFADQIRGKGSTWLSENLRATGDADNAPGLKQQWSCSCAPTTAEVVRAEMDPIFALKLHQENTDITQADPRPRNPYDPSEYTGGTGPKGDRGVADDQREILEGNDGNAVERNKEGGRGMPTDDALNTETKWTGITYEGHEARPMSHYDVGGPGNAAFHQIGQERLDTAMAKLDADLANGIPCALRITDADNAGGHAVAVTGVQAGPPKTYIIHDPWDGKTVHVKASDLAQGKIEPPIAGWTELGAVYTSKQ
jgi:hypothetical protein